MPPVAQIQDRRGHGPVLDQERELDDEDLEPRWSRFALRDQIQTQRSPYGDVEGERPAARTEFIDGLAEGQDVVAILPGLVPVERPGQQVHDFLGPSAEGP